MNVSEPVTMTNCAIAGGGPAGAVLAYMLAHEGVDVTLLEMHKDFNRDFRGDTLHPSTLEIMDELGLAERLLQLPHSKLSRASVPTAGGAFNVIDLSHLHTKFPYIAFMPQARFLDFIVSEAKQYPSFHLLMGARVDHLVDEDGAIRGVRYQAGGKDHELRATLTIGSDGRFSVLRKVSGLGESAVHASAPMDILWFRLARRPDETHGVLGRFGRGHLLIQLDRDTQWQIGLVIPKDTFSALRAAGIESLRNMIAGTAPELADRLAELRDWKQTSLLSVQADRLRRWHIPGLLLIGDAAHVMSPAGGNGINYAIMDAVAAANILSGPLHHGRVTENDLARVQRRRERATRIIQAIVSVIQENVLRPALSSDEPFSPPKIMAWPVVGDVAARVMGFGIGRSTSIVPEYQIPIGISIQGDNTHLMDGVVKANGGTRASRLGLKAWLVAITAALGITAFIAVTLSIVAHPGAPGIGGQPAWFRVLFGLVWGPIVFVAGLLLLWHAPRSMAGQFVCVVSLALMLSQCTFDLGSAWLSALVTDLFLIFGGGIVIPSLGYFMATFPDGRVFPALLRPLLMAGVVIKFVGAALEIMASPGQIKIFALAASPLLIPALVPFRPLIAATIGLTGTLLPASLAIGLGSLLFRYRLAGTQTRQQIKWVIWALGVLVIAVLLAMILILGWGGQLTENNYAFGAIIVLLAQLGFIAALMIAVFRYHLFNVDILINRSLVYSALTASILALYILLVGVLSVLFQTSGSLLISLFATGIVAMLFQPLRVRLQREVNRILYGERDEPYAVLSRLGRRLGATFVPDEALMAVVETLTQALKLPYAALYIGSMNTRTLRAEYGRRPAPDAGLVAFSLTYQGEWVGNLEVGQRNPAEPFTATERRLIEDIAHQAGAAAYAAGLTADLQRSREQLVTSREEERRRLRRDLHDGLGTTLTGVRLKIGQVLSQLPADSPYTALLADAKAQTQQAVSEMRRLVYDLRPPVLDELGLIDALREHAARFGFDFHTPDRLPALSAAVEVAAYRITTEAMNNVVRHSRTTRCVVCIRLRDGQQEGDDASALGAMVRRQPTLVVEVVDDGIGIPPHAREGVGLTSMRERASELGGTFSIERIPNGGTRVLARLPLGDARSGQSTKEGNARADDGSNSSADCG